MTILETELAAHLDANERTLWHGRPPSGILFRAHDVFFVPFSLLWFGFALFWEGSVLGLTIDSPKETPFIVPIVGFFFVCIGFYMAIGRFVWDAYVRAHTFYALTNRRAIVFARAPSVHMRSIEITPATEVTTEERSDGSGTIVFGARATPPVGWRGLPTSGAADDFAFERIRAVREVVAAVRKVQSAAKLQ